MHATQPHRLYPNDIFYTRTIGEKQYELTDHLGNVRATVTDRKVGNFVYPQAGDWTIEGFEPEVASANDYYPGGMMMPGRKLVPPESYRYGFNTQEKIDEIKGSGNHLTAKYWEYDPRIGRRWNMDPVYTASESRYAANGNNPIYYNDPMGDFKTKFGAWIYKLFHGGEIGEVSKGPNKGEFFVSKDYTSTENGIFGVTSKRTFEWKQKGGIAVYGAMDYGAPKLPKAANPPDGSIEHNGLTGIVKFLRSIQMFSEWLGGSHDRPDIKNDFDPNEEEDDDESNPDLNTNGADDEGSTVLEKPNHRKVYEDVHESIHGDSVKVVHIRNGDTTGVYMFPRDDKSSEGYRGGGRIIQSITTNR